MRLRLSLAILLAAAAVAPAALAQPKPDKPKADSAKPDKPGAKPEPLEPREEAARALAKQAEARLAEQRKRGIEACERGDLDEGLATLASVWSRKSDPDVGGALGMCEMKAKLWPSAADHLAAALRVKQDGPDRKRLEEAFIETRKHVGAVRVTVNVEGADVFLGSRFVGQTPLPGEVFVEPGKRTTIVVKKTGFDEAQSSVEVAAERVASVKLAMVAEAPGRNRYALESRTRVPFYVLGGAALVAGGVGAALYAAAVSKGAAADDLLAELKSAHGSTPCQPSAAGCTTIGNLRSSHDTFMNVGTGFFIGGGVLLGAAVLTGVWAFTGGSPPSAGLSTSGPRAASITLAPVVSPDVSGLWLRGSF
jgi:hypothetical protein